MRDGTLNTHRRPWRVLRPAVNEKLCREAGQKDV